jgi:hypothetical protein
MCSMCCRGGDVLCATLYAGNYPWKLCNLFWRLDVVLYALEMLGGCVPCDTLYAGCVRGAGVIRCVLLFLLEAVSCVLLCMLEAVECGLSFEVSKFPLWQFSLL